jgi:DNA-binding transcriptional regulator YhcF (GntR family)
VTSLTVNLDSPIPVSEQIRSQVATLVAVGTLTSGDRLPASRDLARDLGIAVGTVQRAYRELEASGVVVSRRRTGTVIAPHSRPSAMGQASDELLADIRALVAAARAAHLDDEIVLNLVRNAQAASATP